MKRVKENFTKEVSALVKIFMAFGLYPISLNSRFQIVLHIHQLLIGFFIIGVFVGRFFMSDDFEHNNVSTMVWGLVFTSQTVAHLVTISEAFFTKKKQREFFELLSQINEFFGTKLALDVDVKKIKHTVAIRSVAIMLIPVLCKIVSFSATTGRIHFMFWHTLYAIVAVTLRVLQNMVYVTLVEVHLNFLNNNLKEIVKRNSKFHPYTIFVQEYHQVRQITTPKPNAVSNNAQILVLKQIYSLLWDAMNLINDSFGWSLLILSIFYFLTFTSHAYGLFTNMERKIHPSYLIVFHICEMIPAAFILGMLAWTCQKCRSSGEDTGIMLHKIEKLDSEQHDAIVSEFSLQVIHEPFQMSANGFFTINFEFLGSMAAASMTYLVILIQFMFNEKK